MSASVTCQRAESRAQCQATVERSVKDLALRLHTVLIVILAAEARARTRAVGSAKRPSAKKSEKTLWEQKLEYSRVGN